MEKKKLILYVSSEGGINLPDSFFKYIKEITENKSDLKLTFKHDQPLVDYDLKIKPFFSFTSIKGEIDGNVSYFPSDKYDEYYQKRKMFKEYLSVNDLLKDNPYRQKTSIGRLFLKILSDIENYYNFKIDDKEKLKMAEQVSTDFKVEIAKFNMDYTIEILNGSEILNGYDVKNYSENRPGSTLHTSCMNNKLKLNGFFNFYTTNPEQISLVICKNKENKIEGRAILWKGEFTDTYGKVPFLDRIYYSSIPIYTKMISWANQNKYFFKDHDDSSSNIIINNQNFYYLIKLTNINFNFYPYLDTLDLLDVSTGRLTNNIDVLKARSKEEGKKWIEIFKLKNTDGTPRTGKYGL